MAKIVIGIGTSQSPLVTIDAANWAEQGKNDVIRENLYRPDGTRVSYRQLLDEAGDRFKDIVAPPNFAKVSAVVKAAVQRLCEELAAARPDVLVVIGDDQAEIFERSNFPAVSIYCGATLSNNPEALPPGTAEWIHTKRESARIDPARRYPAAPEFATELVERLIDMEVDVATVSEPSNAAKGIGHAWAFVTNRLVDGRPVPVVPVILNTWYLPNVPTPARCYAIGQKLRAAIEASPRDLRVAVIASGGLTHYVLNEELDRKVMAALKAGDADTLRNLPRKALLEGAGQVLDWVVLAGAVEGLKNRWVEYRPGYRSPGGTGVGLGFASWS